MTLGGMIRARDGSERPRVYEERDRDSDDWRDSLMHDLDLPRGEDRELVVDRDRVYELNGEDSRTLAAVGTFRVVPEQTSTPTTIPFAISATRVSSTPSISGRRARSHAHESGPGSTGFPRV